MLHPVKLSHNGGGGYNLGWHQAPCNASQPWSQYQPSHTRQLGHKMLFTQSTWSHAQHVIAEDVKCIKEEHLRHTASESPSLSATLNYPFSTEILHNHWVPMRNELTNEAIPNIWKEDGASNPLRKSHGLWGGHLQVLMLVDPHRAIYEAYGWLNSYHLKSE